MVIASELTACGTLIELKSVKATHGPDVVKAAWRLIPAEERMRLKGICQTEEKLTGETPQVIEQTQPKTRTLFSIGTDLEKLNELLDEAGDDAQQQELISQWLDDLGDERDRKLDGYAALITEMLARAEVRKAEAKRLQELAATDDNRARLLKDRLKCFFETHDLKTVQTPRYKLSLANNGGKLPLILDDSVPMSELPERFQKVSIDPNTALIREALSAGEVLEFAQLGERGTSMRIK